MNNYQNNEKRKIILVNSDGEHKEMESNKGAEAVLISTKDILQNFFPDAEFITTIQVSERLERDLGWSVIKNKTFSYRTYSIFTSFKSSTDLLRCFLWNVVYKFTKLDLKMLVSNEKLKAYHDADVIIHLGMDLYSEDFGFRTVLEHSKDLLQAALLRKKVVMWAESIGPFKNKLIQGLAKFTLKRVSLITVREEITKSYLLNTLSIDKNKVFTTMDPAFIMEPLNRNKISHILKENKFTENKRPLVGMSLSLTYLAGGVKKPLKISLINNIAKTLQYILPEDLFSIFLVRGKKSNTYSNARIEYTKLIADVVDFIVEELDANVCLIPHLQHPLIGELPIHEMVLQQSKHKDRIILISDYCTTQEIKTIIGQCDFFIGGRMHACIAALSQNIPTVGLSYSYKFQGIAGMIGLDKYICSEITYENMVQKVMEAWNIKEEIKIELENNHQNVVRKAFENGKLVQKILNVM